MEPADKHHEKRYQITVDNKKFEWHRASIIGAEVKTLVNAKPDYGVWLVVPGPAEDREIGNNEHVDLTKPGVERFITGPKQTTEGEGGFLPSRDRSYLGEKQIKFEEIEADGQRGIILRNYPLPIDRFDASYADILIIIPTGYADVAPDMFYTLPWLKTKATGAYPKAADVPFSFGGQTWQRWSRHNPEWRAGIDGFWLMLKRIEHALHTAS
jgi:hypothetical protein